jgi:hypothetical protein
MPGRVQRGLLPSRSHAQNAKQPAISPMAASKYHSKDLIERIPLRPRSSRTPACPNTDIAGYDLRAVAWL